MPVALKFSKLFYEKFGQQATNELVDAINVIDASHRTEFTELRDAIARLEAKMDARFAAHDLRFAQLEALIERRTAELSRFMLLGWATTIAALIGTLALK